MAKLKTSLADATAKAMQVAPGPDELDVEDNLDEQLSEAPADAAVARTIERQQAGEPEPAPADEPEAPTDEPEVPMSPPPTPAASTAKAPPKAAPAPVAAAPEPDPWGDAEEVTYEDDNGDKIVVRAKKSDAARVRNGYARTSIMSRATGWAARYRPIFEPLIQQGRMDVYAGMIQLAETNEDFARAASRLAERARLGLPLTDAASQQTLAQAAQAGQNLTPQAPQQTDQEDIFGVGQRVNQALSPLQQQLQAQEQELQAMRQQRQMQVWWEQAARYGSEQAYNLMRMRFPDQFTGGPEDNTRLTNLWAKAREAGYDVEVGADQDPRKMPAAILLAQLDMERDRLASYVHTDAPPARAAIAALDAAATNAARAAGSAIAAATAGGSTAAPASRPVAPGDIRIATVDPKTGRRLNAQQYGAKWLRAQEKAQEAG